MFSLFVLFINFASVDSSTHVAGTDPNHHQCSHPELPVVLTQDVCRKTLFKDPAGLFRKCKWNDECKDADRLANLVPTQAECSKGGPLQWVQGRSTCTAAPPADWKDIPAILGFGSSVMQHCGTPPDVMKKIATCEKDGEYPIDLPTSCCMSPGKLYNRLWLADWTFCKNMQWTFCAGAGFLPSQAQATGGGGQIFLTQDNPKSTGTFASGFSVDAKTVGDTAQITVHELCLLDRICSNADELWKAKNNAIFHCKYDAKAVAALFPKKKSELHSAAREAGEVGISAKTHDHTEADWSASQGDAKVESKVAAQEGLLSNGFSLIADHGVLFLSLASFAILVIYMAHLSPSAKQAEDQQSLLMEANEEL